MYADDSQIYLSVKPGNSEISAYQTLECVINEIRKWMYQNKLKLNDNKTEFMVLGTKQQLSKVYKSDVQVGDDIICKNHVTRNLGVHIDEHLKMTEHVNFVCRTAMFHLRNIRIIRKCLSKEATEVLVNALVTSRLDYCNGLLYGIAGFNMDKLQRVQNNAARVILQLPKFAHITPAIMSLHWLPIKFRIVFKILLVTFKCIHGIGPVYLSGLLKFYAPSRTNMRSSSLLHLQVPRSKSVRAGDISFSVAAPRLWNSLPLYVKQAENVSIFKSRLKSYLFSDAHHV